MFLEHYGLIEHPFGVDAGPSIFAPGPEASRGSRVAGVRHGIESRVSCADRRAGHGQDFPAAPISRRSVRTRTAYIFQTDCDSREFLRHLLTDLGVDATGHDIAAMHAVLNRFFSTRCAPGDVSFW